MTILPSRRPALPAVLRLQALLSTPMPALLLLALAPALRAETLVVPLDHPTLGAALAVAGPGDVVEVRPGHYQESVVVSGRDQVTIQAIGKVVWEAAPDDPASTALRLEGCDRFEVRGVRFTGGTGLSALSCGGLLVRRCRFEAMDTGLRVEDGHGLTVRDGRFRDLTEGVVLDGGLTASVTRCRFQGVTDTALRGDNLFTGVISRCVLRDVVHGVSLRGASRHVLVAANRMQRVQGLAVELEGPDHEVRRNVLRDVGSGMRLGSFEQTGVAVLDNRIARCQGTALQGEGEAMLFARNRVRGAGLHGLEVRYREALLLGNVVRGCGGRGLSVLGTRSTAVDNRVSGSGELDVFATFPAELSWIGGKAKTLTEGLEWTSSGETIRVPADLGLEEALAQVADGGTVEIAGGTYAVNAVLSGREGVTLRAKGQVTLTPGPLTTPTLRVSGCRLVVLDGLAFEGTGTGLDVSDSEGVVVDDADFGPGDTGLDARDVLGLVLRDGEFADVDLAVHLRDVAASAVLDGEFGSAASDAIRLEDSGSLAVRGNTFDDCARVLRGSGLVENVSFTANRVDGSTFGVSTQGSGHHLHDNSFRGGSFGVLLVGRDAILTGNRFRDTGNSSMQSLQGLEAFGTILLGNRVRNSGNTAVSLSDPHQLVLENDVRGSQLSGLVLTGGIFDARGVAAFNTVRASGQLDVVLGFGGLAFDNLTDG